MKKLFCCITIFLIATSCAPRIDRLGYISDQADYEMLQEGVTNKEILLKVMGSPTIISDLDRDEAWIYYSEEVDRFLFFKPSIINRDILVVRFNKDIVRELKKIDLSQENSELTFAINKTNVNSHKVGLIKSFFSNVGQITAQ